MSIRMYLLFFSISFIFFFYDLFFFFNPELFINVIIFVFLVYFIRLYNELNIKLSIIQKNDLKKKNFLFIQTVLIQWKRIQIRNTLIKKFYVLLFIQHMFKYVLNYIIILSKSINKKINFFVNTFYIHKLSLIATALNEKETIFTLNKNNLLNFWFYNTSTFKK